MANLSQQKREKLLAFLQTLREQHTDDDSLIAIGEIERELTEKKYGLVWEQHEEAVDIRMQTHIPVFTEATDLEIKGDSSTDRFNFLLEGDNLHSLRLLEKTHKGKIDVIYIDPPYNTGSRDFRYDDAFVDALDGFRHSKWLSFMEKRLFVAKNLLRSTGVIFISIDDNECAQLKLLCDEVFREECFVADVSWQRTYSTRNDSKGIVSEVEHILVYSKTPDWQPNKLPRTAEMDAKYKNPDNDVAPWRSDNAYAPGAATHQGMVYAIQHPFTGELLYPTNGSCWRYQQDQMLEYMRGWTEYKLEDIHDDAKRAEVCGVSVDNIRKGVKSIVLAKPLEIAREEAKLVYKTGPMPRFFFSKGGKGGIARKTYLENVGGKPPTNFWSFNDVGHTDGAKKQLKDIFSGKTPFDTPKPTTLITRILQIAADKDCTVLDFFAGSGTTGQAVLEQNKEDGGNRRFILCTNNENGICDSVTYPRIQTVITGKRQDGSEYSDGIPANLMYYRTDFVDKASEDLSDDLLEHIREMIQLEHGVKVDGKQYVIILDDEEMVEFEQHISDYPALKAVFINSDILISESQEKLLRSIKSYTIPDYYFDFELREAGEIW